MNKHLSLFLLLFLVMSTTTQAQSVIPIVQEEQAGQGSFKITPTTSFYSNLSKDESAFIIELFNKEGIELKKSKRIKSGETISLTLDKTLESTLGVEGYKMDVSESGISISSATEAGAFYGVQTLIQLSQKNSDGTFSVKSTSIKDYPRYEYRGFMLDVSRHFRDKDFVLKQIDALSRYKLNHLHLHLTDAAGWRIEIEKYPLLTEVAAWRPSEVWKPWWFSGDRKYSHIDDEDAAGGYYTKEDLKEIVEYAAKRNMIIIPEIEMPAHSEEVLAVYPELSCSGEPYKHADFCVGNEQTFTFLEDVLTEVMEIFPSEYIHIGGDEAGKQAWHTCPKCQQRMKDEGLKDVDELQSYLIHRIEVFLNSKGRKLLGWDEILEGGLAPNATVMSWRGEEGGIKAIEGGHKAIMTPGATCYFDAYQDAPHTQPEAIGGYIPLEKVYTYNPSGSLTKEQEKLLYGVQANLWTEYVPTQEHCEYMIYPRILALAEVAWSNEERKSYDNFRERALVENNYLDSKGYSVFDLKTEIGNRKEASEEKQHLAVGKKVIYNAPFNTSYPAAGESTLTDGQYGGWTYSDGRWQGFISAKRLDVTIDLEKDTDISSISADFMQVVGPEVFLPVEVIISASSDGQTYETLYTATHEINKSSAVVFEKHLWSGTSKARYVRFEAKASREIGGWIFTDEIVIE